MAAWLDDLPAASVSSWLTPLLGVAAEPAAELGVAYTVANNRHCTASPLEVDVKLSCLSWASSRMLTTGMGGTCMASTNSGVADSSQQQA